MKHVPATPRQGGYRQQDQRHVARHSIRNQGADHAYLREGQQGHARHVNQEERQAQPQLGRQRRHQSREQRVIVLGAVKEEEILVEEPFSCPVHDLRGVELGVMGNAPVRLNQAAKGIQDQEETPLSSRNLVQRVLQVTSERAQVAIHGYQRQRPENRTASITKL